MLFEEFRDRNKQESMVIFKDIISPSDQDKDPNGGILMLPDTSVSFSQLSKYLLDNYNIKISRLHENNN